MRPEEALRELLNVALRAGIEVRTEPLDPDLFERRRGGICRIDGVRTIVVDSAAPTEEKVAVLIRALATVELDAVYILPELRARIEGQKAADQVRRA